MIYFLVNIYKANFCAIRPRMGSQGAADNRDTAQSGTMIPAGMVSKLGEPIKAGFAGCKAGKRVPMKARNPHSVAPTP